MNIYEPGHRKEKQYPLTYVAMNSPLSQDWMIIKLWCALLSGSTCQMVFADSPFFSLHTQRIISKTSPRTSYWSDRLPPLSLLHRKYRVLVSTQVNIHAAGKCCNRRLLACSSNNKLLSCMQLLSCLLSQMAELENRDPIFFGVNSSSLWWTTMYSVWL